jgi:hypothetical protein
MGMPRCFHQGGNIVIFWWWGQQVSQIIIMFLLAMTLVLLQATALHRGHRHTLGHSVGENGAIILLLTVL